MVIASAELMPKMKNQNSMVSNSEAIVDLVKRPISAQKQKR